MKRLSNKVTDYILIGITIFLTVFIISIIVAAAITGWHPDPSTPRPTFAPTVIVP